MGARSPAATRRVPRLTPGRARPGVSTGAVRAPGAQTRGGVTDRAQARPTGRAPPMDGARGHAANARQDPHRARPADRSACQRCAAPPWRVFVPSAASGGLATVRRAVCQTAPWAWATLETRPPPRAHPGSPRASGHGAPHALVPRGVSGGTAREAPCARRRLPGGVWSRRGRARARAHAAQGPRGGGPRGLRRCPGVRSCPGVRVGPCPDALLTWLWERDALGRGVLCGFAWLQTSLPRSIFRLMNNSG